MKLKDAILWLDSPKMFKYKPVLAFTRSRSKVYFLSVTIHSLPKDKYPGGKMRFAASGINYEPLIDDIASRILTFMAEL